MGRVSFGGAPGSGEDWAEHQDDNPKISSTMNTRDGADVQKYLVVSGILVNGISVSPGTARKERGRLGGPKTRQKPGGYS